MASDPPDRTTFCLPQSTAVDVYLATACVTALATSFQAGENASRFAAMQSAERNIKDRLQLLRNEYAQTRQTTFAEELLDVVTGFEALRTSGKDT